LGMSLGGQCKFGLSQKMLGGAATFGKVGSGMAQRVRDSGLGLEMVLAYEIHQGVQIDYRKADVQGQRLFITGLPSSIDDVRLYLAFESFGCLIEANVAKPGLGFVVFADVETADLALQSMDGELISGKEVKVKRARSYYIRKEEQARLKFAQAQRDRESMNQAIVQERDARVRAAEEDHYAGTGDLGRHVREFDIKSQRRQEMQRLRAEGVVAGGATARPAFLTGRRNVGRPVVAPVLDPKPQRGQMQRAPLPTPPPAKISALRDKITVNGGLPKKDSSDAANQERKASVAAEEERIRKQAMIEIMKEGDKLSKSGLKNMDPTDINIALLIKERVEQIRRYEHLKQNRELLGQITFTAAATPNARSKKEKEEEEQSGDNIEVDIELTDMRDVVVTDEEEALVEMIGEEYEKSKVKIASAQELTTNLKAGVEAVTAPKKRGRKKQAKAGSKKGYVPTGRPRGRPRKTPVAK